MALRTSISASLNASSGRPSNHVIVSRRRVESSASGVATCTWGTDLSIARYSAMWRRSRS